MLYEMITGITPYWNENANLMYRRILYEENIEFPSFMGLEARDIITKVSAEEIRRRKAFTFVVIVANIQEAN